MKHNFILLIILYCATAQELCQDGCQHKSEYCDPYESKCKQCEEICLPPTNQKFAECGKHCSNFLQDLLIQHFQEPKSQIANLNTLESLTIVATCFTIFTWLLVTIPLVVKLVEKSKNGKKINEILPMYQIENGTIRTLSTNVPENTSSRIPVEDRAPSEVGYDNPVMNMNP